VDNASVCSRHHIPKAADQAHHIVFSSCLESTGFQGGHATCHRKQFDFRAKSTIRFLEKSGKMSVETIRVPEKTGKFSYDFFFFLIRGQICRIPETTHPWFSIKHDTVA
jgi:hypothetical protein